MAWRAVGTGVERVRGNLLRGMAALFPASRVHSLAKDGE